ncbi:MAG TPA: HTTM domain-containing protein [Pirellulaceae bacterium]|jgi:hypothetical protein
MNPAPWNLRSTWAAFTRGWQRFFHEPCDARVCAAIRIAFASLVLIHFAVLYPDLDRFFTDKGVLPLEAALRIAHPYSLSILAYTPQTSAAIHICWLLAVAHAIALLIGLLPRVNALLLFAWIVSFQIRNDLIDDGEDVLMRMLSFFVILLPSGQCWSVNSLIRRWWHGTPTSPDRYLAPGWPLRLFQIEMAALFLSSGLIKLGGTMWLNGSALYYVSRLDDLFGRFYVPAWVFDTPWVVVCITWSVLLAETLAPFFIWFRETRLVCLIIVVFFHLANEWTMNLFLFHWLMLCGWISFVSPSDFSWGAKRGIAHRRLGSQNAC